MMDSLKEENQLLKKELRELKAQLNLVNKPELGYLNIENNPDQSSMNHKQERTDSLDQPCRPLFGPGKLSKNQVLRYSRQAILDEVGSVGISKLQKSRVLVIGVGGLGSSILQNLVCSGVGFIRIVDDDVVDVSNLHRQVLHKNINCGKEKVLSAKEMCLSLNPTCNIEAIYARFNSGNAYELCKDIQIVVDGCDNMPTRYLINKVCAILNLPMVSGAAMRWNGQITTFPGEIIDTYGKTVRSACYQCLFPYSPSMDNCDSCSNTGVFGVIPGIIGCLQALETMKIIIGCGIVLNGKVVFFDGLTHTFRTARMRSRNPNCSICGDDALMKYKNNNTKELIESQPNKFISPNIISDYRFDLSSTFEEYLKIKKDNLITIDVRNKNQHDLCIPHGIKAYNIPFSSFTFPNNISESLMCPGIKEIQNLVNNYFENKTDLIQNIKVYFLCRRGINSMKTAILMDAIKKSKSVFKNVEFYSLEGGLSAYSKLDSSFPWY